jgi:PAS domain S-box-containing protein
MSSSSSESEPLRGEAARFRAAFVKALTGMALVGPDGGFLEVNPAFCEMLGYSRDELLGLRFHDVTHADDREVSRRRFREMLDGERTDLRLEKRYVRPDGRHVWALLSSHLERDDDGRPSYFVSQVVDITERKDAEEAKALAEQSRNAFLATMNHGLRTPLNGILGMSRLLLEGGLPDAQRRQAEIIHSSAESLLALIDELLDLSKVEAGQLPLDEEDFRLRELVRECIELLRHRARAKRIDLRFTVSDETPNALRGDPRRLRRVLLNLVGNAVQLTRRGFVLVSVAAETPRDDTAAETPRDDTAAQTPRDDTAAQTPRDDTAAQTPRDDTAAEAFARVRFSVRDTGTGIAPERLPRIFDPLTHQEEGRPPGGGNGIGLATCQRLVGLMGGEIVVESEPGQGSTFSFAVPLAPARDPQGLRARPGAGKAEAADRRRGSFRVLVAEDDEANRLLALQVLADAGYEADAVDNGIEALEALEQASYDLILMDCQMPELDGYEAARLIRQLEKGQGGARTIPIVAVTARTLKGDREKCAEAGMDDFVAKPYRTADLVLAVDRNLGLSRPAAVRGPAAGRGSSSGSGAVLDADVFRQLRELAQPTQEELLANLVEMFVGERSERFAALRQALEARQSRQLSELAHKLISAAGSVGAYRLAKVAGELEIRARADDLGACEDLLAKLAAEYDKAATALGDLTTPAG